MIDIAQRSFHRQAVERVFSTALLPLFVSGLQRQQLSITVERLQMSVSVHVFRQDVKQSRSVATPLPSPSLPHTQTQGAI